MFAADAGQIKWNSTADIKINIINIIFLMNPTIRI